MGRITQEQIIQINRLYQVKGIYAQVAREMGISASTVKKYVDPNFKDIQIEVPKTEVIIQDFEVARFNELTKRELFYLSAEEEKELEEVRKEILI